MKKPASNPIYTAYEYAVFDKAVMFTVAGYRGRGTRSWMKFATPQEAMDHAATVPGCCVYAANAAGRQIVLDKAMWPQWLTRFAANREKANA